MNDKPRLIDANKLYQYFLGVDGRRFPDKDIDGFPSMVELAMVKKIIKNTPTIDAVPQWIPVSENDMPQDDKEVLVTTVEGIVATATYCGYGDHEEPEFLDCEGGSLHVIAWMPLPEPYQAKMDGKDGKNNE